MHRSYLWWPITANQKINKKNKKKKKKNNKMKNENKKMEKMKNYYSEKKPTKISWPMSVKSDQRKILFKNKTSTK